MTTTVRGFMTIAAISIAAALPAPQSAVQAQIVKIDRLDNAVVRITYDLPGAPESIFTVIVEASNDGGQTYGIQPRAVSGDTGANVRGGAGRTIEWDSAKDIEDLQFDRLVFRIRATPSTPIGTGAPAGGNRATATGSVRIVSEPAGASVAIDGQPRGQTPATLTDLSVGNHRVTLTLAGYLDNSRTVAVASGRQTDVQVSLTRGTPTTATSGGGGMPKWIIPVLGAGAGGAVLAAKAGSGGSSGSGASASTPACSLSVFVSSTGAPFQGAVLLYPLNGGVQTATVTVAQLPCTGSTSWTAVGRTDDPTFIRVDPASGGGDGTVQITVPTRNGGTAFRLGQVTIADKTASIQQSCQTCPF